jgi:hypothetical protein
MTAPYTRQDGQGAILLAVEYSWAAWVGLQAAKQGTRGEALEPIRQGGRPSWGALGPESAQGLLLRPKHGSQKRAHGFQETLPFLGLLSAPALVRAPTGNGCAARLMRTRKEHR